MAELDEFKELKERGLDRILGLSDGIFGFALTLMVLDLVSPEDERDSRDDHGPPSDTSSSRTESLFVAITAAYARRA